MIVFQCSCGGDLLQTSADIFVCENCGSVIDEPSYEPTDNTEPEDEER